MKNTPKNIFFLFLLGAVGGLLGEGLLFVRAHCELAERLLIEDFRAVVFLDIGTGESRRKVIEEKIIAQPPAESARFVSSEQSLAEIEAEDAEFARTVALLGNNPLPGALEIAFDAEGLSRVDAWAGEVRAIAGVRDVRYKTLQAAAALQIRFYQRLLTMVLVMAVLLWSLGGAFLAWTTLLDVAALRRALGEGWVMRSAAAAGGTCIGIILTAVIALPGTPAEGLHAWPSLGAQLLLLAGGAFAGVFFDAPFIVARMNVRSRESSPRAGGRLVAAVMILALLSPQVAQAASARAKKAELGKVKKELERKKRELARARKERDLLNKNLKGQVRSVGRAESALRRMEGRRAKNEKKFHEIEGKLSAVEKTREEGLKILAEEMSQYRRLRAGESKYFGREGVWEDALRRSAIADKTMYLAQLGTVQSSLASSHLAASNEGRLLSARASRAMANLIGQRKRAERTKTEFERSRKRTDMTLKEVHSLEESAKEIAALIKKLQNNSKKPYKSAGTAPAFARHSLSWPLAGKVITTFGKKRVPALKTWVINNGIEISAATGESVSSVAAGEVIYAGDFRSYGNVVIVDHGKGFVSIYGHLGQILRKAGDRVAVRQAIASVGNSQEETGVIYLEMRQGSHALDPIAWLKKR